MPEFHLPCVCVEVIEIHKDALIEPDSHRCEALGRETVGPRGIGTGVPFNTRKIDPGIICQRIQPRADSGAACCWSAIRMAIGFIEMRVVVEVLWQVSNWY